MTCRQVGPNPRISIRILGNYTKDVTVRIGWCCTKNAICDLPDIMYSTYVGWTEDSWDFVPFPKSFCVSYGPMFKVELPSPPRSIADPFLEVDVNVSNVSIECSDGSANYVIA